MKPAARLLWLKDMKATPLGPLCLAANAQGLCGLWYGTLSSVPADWLTAASGSPAPKHLSEAVNQLTDYLNGERRIFDLPLDLTGLPPFHRAALEACARIPFGQTRSYGELARLLGRPRGAARAVGSAMAHNPLPILIPCHRVLGSSGELHGYTAPGGLAVKAWLLNLEGIHLGI